MAELSAQPAWAADEALLRQHAADAAYLWQVLEDSQASLLMTAAGIDDRHRRLQANLEGLMAAGQAGADAALNALRRFGGAGEAFVAWQVVAGQPGQVMKDGWEKLRELSHWLTSDVPEQVMSDAQAAMARGIADALASWPLARLNRWMGASSDLGNPYVQVTLLDALARRIRLRSEAPPANLRDWIRDSSKHADGFVRAAAYVAIQASFHRRFEAPGLEGLGAELRTMISQLGQQSPSPQEPSEALCLAQARAIETRAWVPGPALSVALALELGRLWVQTYRVSLGLRGRPLFNAQRALADALRALASQWPGQGPDCEAATRAFVNALAPGPGCRFVGFFGEPSLCALALPVLDDVKFGAAAAWTLQSCCGLRVDAPPDPQQEASLAESAAKGPPGEAEWHALFLGLPAPDSAALRGLWQQGTFKTWSGKQHWQGELVSDAQVQRILGADESAQAARWMAGRWLHQQGGGEPGFDTRHPRFGLVFS